MLEKHVKDEFQPPVTKASDIGVVAFQNEVMKVLRGHGLAYSQRIVPDRVGVSKVNRDGFGVSPRDCHRLLCLIADLGWDDRAVQMVNLVYQLFSPIPSDMLPSAALTPTLHFDVACIKCHTRIQTRP